MPDIFFVFTSSLWHNLIQRQMKELMVRAIYCEMLGYEASFSYIHAIKLAQQGTALEKRVGMFFVITHSSESLPNGSAILSLSHDQHMVHD